MTRIDRYVLEKTLGPLSATVGIALVALLMERMVRLMEVLVGQGGPLITVLKMLSNLVPHYLGLALPAALFIGILLATTRLSVDSELDALQSVGVGLKRLLRPLMVLTFGVAAITFVLYATLQPYTRYAYRALMYAATHSTWDVALEKGAFFTGVGKYTVLINDITDGGRVLSGVFVQERQDNGDAITMTAQWGEAYRVPDELRVVLRLHQGTRIEFPVDPAARPKILVFDQFDVPLEMALPEPFRDRTRERELTLWELWQQRNTTGEDPTKYEVRAEFHGRVVRTLSLLALPLLAVPLGLATRRNQRGVGIAVGVVVMVFYHNLLNLCESMAGSGRVAPWLALWVPFLLFAGGSLWLFFMVSDRPRENAVSIVIGAVDRLRERLARLLPRRGSRPA